MPSRVQHRRSGTTGVTPSAAALLVGEIGANTADGRLFVRKGAGVATVPNRDDTDAAYQPKHANLTALAGLAAAANKFMVFTGAGTGELADLAPFARPLLAATNQDAALAAILAAPRPQVAIGRGIWSAFTIGVGQPATLPSGGTYAYFVFGVENATGYLRNGVVAGVAAGGTSVTSGVAGCVWYGFCWNIT